MTIDWTIRPDLDAALRRLAEDKQPWAEIAGFLSAMSRPDLISPEQARGRWKRIRGVPSYGPPAGEIVAAAPSEAEKAGERRQVTQLRREVAELTKEAEELRGMVAFYNAARETPLAHETWTIKQASTGHVGLVVAQMADWHLDEVVKPEEVFYLNAYSRKIAETRIRRWVDKVASLPRDYMKGVKIEGLVIPATGDLFTGDIHAELKESNEDKLLGSLLYWMDPIISALEALGREYAGNVEVNAVVGNHGRTTFKPVFKGRARSNVEWLFWSVVRDRLADRKSGVRVNVSDSMDLNVPIYGRNHLVTHGDQFHGGTGIAGAYSPLSLGQHRKGVRQQAAGQDMKLMVMGHFHQFLDLPGTIMGGSMKGYDEYAFGLNLRPEEAKQALWITTPERLKIMTMPVELQNREREGW